MSLGTLTRPHVRAFERHLRDKGLAAGTRKIVRTMLARALADAVEDGLLSRSPVGRRLAENAKAPTRFTVWTKDELRAFLTAVQGDRLEALWRLAVASGLRRGELLGCNWFGFSAAEGTLTVSQQVVPTPGGPTIAVLKTKGSHRTIRLDEATVAAIERHRERQLAERCLAGEAYDDHDLIFANELGGLINPKRLTEAFGTQRKAAKIRPGRLHDVRHSHATHLLTAGVPVHIVAARLGHASPMVTLSIYAHVPPRSDERAAEVMAEVLAVS
jgi:integrase